MNYLRFCADVIKFYFGIEMRVLCNRGLLYFSNRIIDRNCLQREKTSHHLLSSYGRPGIVLVKSYIGNEYRMELSATLLSQDLPKPAESLLL